MKRIMIFVMSILGLFPASLTFAETGEKWEIVTKSEMPGMAMPAVTMNVCIKKGAEKDPANLMQRDNNCKVTDVKTSGGKTSWKMKCDNNGEVMTGSGEVKHKSDSFQGVSRMAGKANGADVDMTANYQGRRLGVACDTNDPPEVAKISGDLGDMMGMVKAQMQSAMAEQCEVSNYTPGDLISTRFFGPSAVCAASQKHACKVIAKEATREPDVYIKLVKRDETSDVSIATLCKLDMNATTKAICLKVNRSNFTELADYCPAEAKAFSSGTAASDSTSLPGEKQEDSSDSVVEGAKKLKGLFGF